jgi:predicted DCC family thiol-disulfide oxidoreductase YuxK
MTTHAILYDPDCGFCRVCLAVVLRWDRERRLRPVALTDPEADSLLMGMPEAERMASWHLVNPGWLGNGAQKTPDPNHPKVWSAGAAFSPLFRVLPMATPLALLAERFSDAAERGYRWVADHRTAFGKTLPAAAEHWADRVISESARGSR